MTPSASTHADRVGPYQLVKAIGAGGSARIDLARIERAYGFQRHVVIKRPLEHLRQDARAAASLRREAHLGGRLRHPNLVSILDAGVHDGYDYLVLEYVQGGSLRDVMQTETGARVRDMPLAVALTIVAEVARGLHEAHELPDESGASLGLVHRDVSPGNVLIGLDGAVKLADFGIAKETRVTTLSGSMHGTVTYMAPEQCRGHAFDRRADVFSLGVILYELATGCRLFWADNDVASLHRVLSGNVPRPRKIRPSLSTGLEEIIMLAIAQDAERRMRTARSLAEALEAHAAETGAILGARQLAHWMHDVVGPRSAPWVEDATVVDVRPLEDVPSVDTAPSSDGSLVELIAATPAGERPMPTFGPTDAALRDEASGAREVMEPQVPGAGPARGSRRGRRLTLLIAAGAIAGAGAGAFLITRSDTPAATAQQRALPTAEDAGSAAPASREVAPEAVAVPEVMAPETAAPEEPAAQATVEPSSEPVKTRRTGLRKSDRPRDRSAATVPPAEPVSGEPAGSGSQETRPSRPRVEWKPTMLFPTDSGSGSKQP